MAVAVCTQSDGRVVVTGFRWALLDAPPPTIETLVISTTITIVVLISGMFYFRRMERTFADLV